MAHIGRHARHGRDCATQEERRCAALLYAVVRQAVRDATAKRLHAKRGGGCEAPYSYEQADARRWLGGRDAEVVARFAGYPLRVARGGAYMSGEVMR